MDSARGAALNLRDGMRLAPPPACSELFLDANEENPRRSEVSRRAFGGRRNSLASARSGLLAGPCLRRWRRVALHGWKMPRALKFWIENCVSVAQEKLPPHLLDCAVVDARRLLTQLSPALLRQVEIMNCAELLQVRVRAAEDKTGESVGAREGLTDRGLSQTFETRRALRRWLCHFYAQREALWKPTSPESSPRRHGRLRRLSSPHSVRARTVCKNAKADLVPSPTAQLQAADSEGGGFFFFFLRAESSSLQLSSPVLLRVLECFERKSEQLTLLHIVELACQVASVASPPQPFSTRSRKRAFPCVACVCEAGASSGLVQRTSSEARFARLGKRRCQGLSTDASVSNRSGQGPSESRTKLLRCFRESMELWPAHLAGLFRKPTRKRRRRQRPCGFGLDAWSSARGSAATWLSHDFGVA